MNLDDLTRRLKELLSGARSSGEGAQARALLDAATKELEQRKQKLLEATYVPDRYRLFLRSEELAALGPLAEAIEVELKKHLAAHASRKGYRLAGEVDLRLVEDDTLAEGEVRAEGAFVGAVETSPPGEPAPPAASAAELPPATESRPSPPAQAGPDRTTRLIEPERATRLKVRGWKLRVATGPEEGRVFEVGAQPLTLGRGRDADLVLEDPQEYLSRVHLRVSAAGETLLVEDLGSANGTLVAGRRIEKESYTGPVRLVLGDIEIDCEPPGRDAPASGDSAEGE